MRPDNPNAPQLTLTERVLAAAAATLDGLTNRGRDRMVETTEGWRRLVHEGIAGSAGTEVADALMELLPHGPSEVATKQDLELHLDALEARLDAKIATLGGELRKEMSAQTRTIMLGLCPTIVGSFAAFAAVAARLSH